MREVVKKCPLLSKPCLEEGCAWFMKTIKTSRELDPKPVPFNACAMLMIPDMLIDVIRNTIGTQAAVESSRNESVRRQDAMLNILGEARASAIEEHQRRALADPAGK